MLRMGIGTNDTAARHQRSHTRAHAKVLDLRKADLARLADEAREANAANAVNNKALLSRAHCARDSAAGTPRAHCARSDIDQLTGRASMPA